MSEIAIKTEKPDGDSASLNEDQGLGVAAAPSSSSNSLEARRQAQGAAAASSTVPALRAAMRAAATQAAASANRNQAPAQHIQLKQQLQRKLKRPPVQPPPPPPPAPKPFLPGARCGEIFVANNARQWTFICTFCNKSTRDIGDFICHIKLKHLQDSGFAPAAAASHIGAGSGYYGDADNDATDMDDFGGNQQQQQQAEEQDVSYNFRHVKNIRVSSSRAIEIIPLRPPPPAPPVETPKKRPTSEYLDCSSYLDVNVHTEEPEELSYNGVSLQQHQHQQTLAKKRQAAEAAAVSSSANKFAKKSTAKSSNPSFVVDLLDDDDDDNKKDGDEDETAVKPEEDYDENDIEQNITKHTSQRAVGLKTEQEKYANANGGRKPKAEAPPMDYDDFDYSDEQYPHAADELRRHNQNSSYFGEGEGDDDEDDDFDNQLLIAPGADDSSLEALALFASIGSGGGAGGAGGSDAKRRQIRGTAYCALCNKTFQYYSLYRNHMIKHSNDTPYKCVLCKKGFKSKQAIRYHMHTHQKEKKYQCQLCHHGYYTENQFITHVLTHENASTFPCMVCGQILRSDKERDHHLATHTEERPFRCEFCNKLFRLRHHLSNHLKMHRQYRCDWCREEFTSAVHLRKPYACPACEQLPEVRANVTQKHRASASSSLDADPSGGAAEMVNPLHLFETVEPPTECVDLAEMVSDSDVDADADEGDEEPPQEYDDDEEEDLTAEPEDNSANGSYLAQQQQQQLAGVQPDRQRLTCKYCHRSYSHLSGLNYHIRMKHR